MIGGKDKQSLVGRIEFYRVLAHPLPAHFPSALALVSAQCPVDTTYEHTLPLNPLRHTYHKDGSSVWRRFRHCVS